MNFTNKIVSFALFGGLLLSANVATAQTIAVGVSPSTYELTMKEGQQAELTYHLSRSETTGDFGFDVELESGEEILDVQATSVTILDGDNTADYQIILDSRGLAVGEYTSFFNFRDNRQRETDEVLSIRYGLQANVALSVMSDADYAVALAEAGIKLNGVQFEKSSEVDGKQSAIRYEVQNPGNVYIDQITHVVTVLDKQGNVIDQISQQDDVDLAPFENKVFMTEFEHDGVGDYIVKVALQYDGVELVEKDTALTVVEPEKTPLLAALTYALIAFGGVVMLVGLAMVLKRR